MSDSCICLSSDEEEPREKKRKATNSCNKSSSSQSSSSKSVISLVSDDENESESQNTIIINDKENGTISSTEIRDTNERTNSSHHENGAGTFVLEKSKNGATTLEKVNGLRENEINNVISIDNMDGDEADQCEDNKRFNMKGLTCEAKSFLQTCENQLNVANRTELVTKKFPSFIKLFKKISDNLSESDYLKVFLEKHTVAASESLRACLMSFKEVYEYLKDIADCEGIELPKNQSKQAKKLEKAIRQVLARIKQLEEEEVEFDGNENNSPYIKLDKYTRHLHKLHKKYCQILKKNPYAGRITHERIDFMSSQYNEINLAICKKYKNNRIFPSHEDIYLLIKTVVEEKELSLNEAQVKAEANHCFKALGELLQQRRKKELYESHCRLIITPDPALEDKELEVKLKEHAKEAKIKIEQIQEEYVKKQELGENGAEDSTEDKSNCSSSDEEDVIPLETVDCSSDKDGD